MSMHVVPSCPLAWPATFCSEYIFSALCCFLSSFCFSPHSLHFRVLLDRTTFAPGDSPLSSQHPKGMWGSEISVCMQMDMCACNSDNVRTCLCVTMLAHIPLYMLCIWGTCGELLASVLHYALYQMTRSPWTLWPPPPCLGSPHSHTAALI